MRAQRCIQWSFARAKANLRFEPLAVLVDQVDYRNRCVADLCGKLDDLVKLRLARGVEDVITIERPKALVLLGVGIGAQNNGPFWVCS